MNLTQHKSIIIAAITAIVIAAGIIIALIFIGDNAKERQALSDDYAAYTALVAERDTRVGDLAGIVEGCHVNVDDNLSGPRKCDDLKVAYDAAVAIEAYEVDVEAVDSGHLEAEREEVTRQTALLQGALDALNVAYDDVDVTLKVERQQFISEVEAEIERVNNTLTAAQEALDGADGSGIDGGLIDPVTTGKADLEAALAYFDKGVENVTRYVDGEAFDSLTTIRQELEWAAKDLSNALALGADDNPQALDPVSAPAASSPASSGSGQQATAQTSKPKSQSATSQTSKPAASSKPATTPAPESSTPDSSGSSEGQWVVTESTDICRAGDSNGNSWEVPCD